MEFNIKDLAHMDEMVKHSFGRKALIETATMKHDENWQDVATPYDICGEMCDLVVGKADKYIVFFSLEFLEVLVFEKGIDPKNITFVGDFYIEAGLASKMYGVNTKLITKNDVIKNGKFCSDIFTFIAIDKQKEEETNYGEDNMKFNKVAVLGNPPYQVNNDKGGETTHASALYNLFVEAVIDNIKPDYFSFIIPSRWMTGGRGLDKFRNRMMNDRHMKKIVHFPGNKEVFNTVSIAGGVNYFLYDNSHNGECEFKVGNTTTKRFLNSHDIILQDNSALDILIKVQEKTQSWMNKSWSGQSPFGVVTSFNNWKESGVKCIKVGHEEKFINISDFTDKHNIITKWKVCTSKATSEGNITADKAGAMAIATNFFIIEPNAICTQTYIVVNVFDTKKEAENFMSYMKTKFFRFMLGLRVLTMDINKEKFAWVPDMQDYSTAWTDKELYEEFKLTRQEVAYIESKIKAI